VTNIGSNLSTPDRDRLILEHAEAARRIALRMARRCPDWLPREDLVAAGMIGLIEAANRFDSSRKEPFFAFAEHRIRGAVLDELRRGDIMPRRVRQLARKIAAAIRELERTDGERPTDARVAQALGVSLDEYRSGLEHLIHVEVEPFDDRAAMLATDEIAPDDQAQRSQTLMRVRKAFERLEPRDVMVLGLHYVEDLTYQQIAEILEITASRVCQLVQRALARLRAHVGSTEAA